MIEETVLHKFTQASPNFPIGATAEYTCSIVKSALEDLVSSDTISSSIYSTLSDPVEFLKFYKDTDPLVSALYFSSGLIVIHYITSEITKNYSQVGKV